MDDLANNNYTGNMSTLRIHEWQNPFYKCFIDALTAIALGTATNAGVNGVDRYVALYCKLPDYYLTQPEAKKLGWKKHLGNLAIAILIF